MRAWINGVGWMTPAGCGMGRAGSEQPLCAGQLDIPTRAQVFEEPDKRFGRLDPFSRVGLAAVAFCLRDAGEEHWTEKRPIGIVASSRYGCLGTDVAYLETMLPDGGKLASPNLFAYTLPNCFLGEAALRFGLTGNSLLLNQKDDNGLCAVRFAMEELSWSGQQGVLAGFCDLPFSEMGLEVDFPGSLFFLLGREPDVRGVNYGELRLSGDQLLFKDKVVPDFSALVKACLGAHFINRFPGNKFQGKPACRDKEAVKR